MSYSISLTATVYIIKDENIKIHIRNTALKCLYIIKNRDGEYFPAHENAIY